MLQNTSLTDSSWTPFALLTPRFNVSSFSFSWHSSYHSTHFSWAALQFQSFCQSLSLSLTTPHYLQPGSVLWTIHLYIQPPMRYLHVPQSYPTFNSSLPAFLCSPQTCSSPSACYPFLPGQHHHVLRCSSRKLEVIKASQPTVTMHWLLNPTDSVFSKSLKTTLSFLFSLPPF